MRLIDADALLEDVRKHSESYFADDFAEYWVDRQPTITPSAQPDLSSYSDKLWRAAYERGKAEAQPKRGMWIKSDTDAFVCSVCRNGYKNQPTIMGKPMFEFCPCCGARMEVNRNDS